MTLAAGWTGRVGCASWASRSQGPEAAIEPRLCVTVNGEERALPIECSLRGLLDLLGLPTRFIAVEVNGALADPQRDLPLAAGDRVEIVRFVGGG